MPSEVPLGVVGGVANWHPVDHHSGYGHHYVALEGRMVHCPLGLFIFVTPSFVTPSFIIPSFITHFFVMSRSVLSFGLFYT